MSDQELHNHSLVANKIIFALDASSDGFAIYDENDELLYCNEQFAKLFGLKPANLIGGTHASMLQYVHAQARFMSLSEKSLAAWLETFASGWRKTPLRSYEIKSIDRGLYLITEQLLEDGTVVCTTADIAHKHYIEQQLKDTETRLQAILDNSPALISVKDDAGRLLLTNKRFEVVKGFDANRALGSTLHDFLPASTADSIWAMDQLALASEHAIEAEEHLVHKDNTEHVYLSSKFCLKTNNGDKFAICTISTDITDRKVFENRILEREQQLSTIVDYAPESIVIYDIDLGTIVQCNANAEELFGLSQEALLESTEDDLNPDFQPDGRSSKLKASEYISQALAGQAPQFEWNHLNSSGQQVPCEVRLVQLPKRDKRWLRASIINITERKATERLLKEQHDHLQFLANHDALTHLPNRRFLNQHLEDTIKLAEANDENSFAVLLLDLDRFKFINDSLGHTLGDKFLQVIAKRLESLTRNTDITCRLGGDEFVIVLDNIKQIEHISAKAEIFLSELSRPVTLLGHELHTTLSIGVSIYPEHGKTPELLIKNADVAMYKAKAEGKNTYEFYHEDLDKKSTDMLQLQNDLRRAIIERQFKLVYQPQISLDQNRIFGAEALIRWDQPGIGIIAPSQFIPFAEETGLINEIGEWLLEEACGQYRRWLDEGKTIDKIAINISAKQFHQPGFIELVEANLKKANIPAEALQLELTETIVMENADHAIKLLERFTDIGVTLALDDFGTGYSSLSYLKRFPIQKLKIDQSFVRDVISDNNDATIVKSVIALAKSMNLEVIAEGVETQKQLDFLYTNGCDQMQGYYIAKPLFSPEFDSFYNNFDAKPILASK